MFQRTIAALTRQIEREQKVTSVNTAEPKVELAKGWEPQKGDFYCPCNVCVALRKALEDAEAAKQVKP